MTAGVALAGCGGSSTPAAEGSQSGPASHVSSSTSASSASASPSASASSTPKVHVGQKVSGAQLTAWIHAADVTAGNADIAERSRSGSRVVSASGVIGYVDGTVRTSLTESLGGMQLHMVMIDNVIYVQVPGQTPPWVEVKAGGTDALSQMLAPLIQQMSQAEAGISSDPRQMWSVDSATAQRTTYVTQRSAAQVHADLVKLFGAALAAEMPPAAPVQVTETLDARNRVEKIVTTRSGQAVSTIAYSNWGTKAAVTAPPANEIGTFGNSSV
ncbi:hypothetical protein [Rudaeicoccus suwonensis]|nr:hypothetical protein [Rudaeicoccus suwonensis]